MENSLREKINEMKDWLVEIRREIHMHPELGFEEVETSRLVSGWLERFGLQVKKGIAKTGVVGLLRGKEPGKTVAIRADMDAFQWRKPIKSLMPPRSKERCMRVAMMPMWRFS